jgi:uncharacterized DUF497 family protein
MLRFEWDPAKSERNYRERGFNFGAAIQIFAGFTLERADTRRDYGETRILAIGQVAGIAISVVYTDRRTRSGGVVRRIISARRCNRHERKRLAAAQSKP